MSNLTVIFSFIFLLLSLPAQGADQCQAVFSDAKQVSAVSTSIRSPSRLEIDFDSKIPLAHQRLIVQTFDRVLSLFGDLKTPGRVAISLENDGRYEIGFAHLIDDRIGLTDSAFRLSEPAFVAMIAHEFTHLIVVRNFHVGSQTSKKQTLREALLAVKEDDYESLVLSRPHTPFAELLCDLVAVLVTRNPKALTEMLAEISELAKKDPKLSELMKRMSEDKPAELSQRNFTLSHEDPRWETYEPKDGDYNRFNQIRAYFGTRWTQRLPVDQQARFFSAVLNALDPLSAGGQFEMLVAMNGLPEANRMILDYLEQTLSTNFK